ncbi:unnamed protein product [Cuscuta epithymum]|uniref:Uncharacterized protein n=1 Tax=Cuscuta epithymum TaxID=186058 RepID=A0AAV0FRB3_9ASTE|nr:unnamed protein product [Cuscuta epithymum]
MFNRYPRIMKFSLTNITTLSITLFDFMPCPPVIRLLVPSTSRRVLTITSKSITWYVSFSFPANNPSTTSIASFQKFSLGEKMEAPCPDVGVTLATCSIVAKPGVRDSVALETGTLLHLLNLI